MSAMPRGMLTGCFTYFAHPDLLHFTGDPAVYDHWMRGLCEDAKKAGLPLEINFLGIGGHRHYPNPAFWKIVGEVGNPVIFGSDAHEPDKVWNPAALKKGEEIVKENGLYLLDTTELVNPAGTLL